MWFVRFFFNGTFLLCASLVRINNNNRLALRAAFLLGEVIRLKLLVGIVEETYKAYDAR